MGSGGSTLKYQFSANICFIPGHFLANCTVGVFSCLIAPVPACSWGLLRKPADFASRPHWPFRAKFHALLAGQITVERDGLRSWHTDAPGRPCKLWPAQRPVLGRFLLGPRIVAHLNPYNVDAVIGFGPHGHAIFPIHPWVRWKIRSVFLLSHSHSPRIEEFI